MSWRVGDVSIDRVVELETIGGTKFLLPDATRSAVQAMDWLCPEFADADGRLVMCIQTYLLKTPTQTILIDTGLGNQKPRPIPLWDDRSGSFLADLQELGVSRHDVDLVICTHLHVDHVGWNTMLVDGRWLPTFPNARYLFGRVEWDYWSKQDHPAFAQVMDDSVRPIVEAGLANLFEFEDRLAPEIQAHPTLGHSIGHTSLWIESAGQRALITGDFLHHPCQAARPTWCSTADHNQEQAIRTRRKMFTMLAEQSTPIFGMHFTGPQQVIAGTDGYRLAAFAGLNPTT